MAEAKVLAFTYNGIEVFLLNGDRFGFEESQNSYTSAQDCRESIDSYLKRKEAVGRKKIALAVIGSNGTEYTITGVHAGTGSLLISPKPDGGRFGNGPELYPNTPEIRAKVLEMHRLLSASKAIEKEIQKNYISWSSYTDGKKGNPLVLLEQKYEAAKG